MEEFKVITKAVITAVVLLFGLIFFGFEYYRAFPIEDHELGNMQRLLTVFSGPFFVWILYDFLRVLVEERRIKMEERRMKLILSPESVFYNSESSPLSPHPPKNPINRGVSDTSGEIEKPIGESVHSAIIAFLRLNGSINFRDMNTIKRIESMVPGTLVKGEVDLELSRMVESGEIISNNDGLVRLNTERNREKMVVESDIKENTANTGIKDPLTANQLNIIFKLLGRIFDDPKELELQKSMMRTADVSEYPAIVHELKENIREIEIEKERLKRKKEREELARMERSETPAEHYRNTEEGTLKQDEKETVNV